MYYSEKNNGWYPDDLSKYQNLPDDLIAVDQGEYESLVNYQVIVKSGKVVKLLDHLSSEQKTEIAAQKKLEIAQLEYDRISTAIVEINDAIEDEDGDLQRLNAQKLKSTNYRKELRAFLKTDGSGDLPIEVQDDTEQ